MTCYSHPPTLPFFFCVCIVADLGGCEKAPDTRLSHQDHGRESQVDQDRGAVRVHFDGNPRMERRTPFEGTPDYLALSHDEIYEKLPRL